MATKKGKGTQGSKPAKVSAKKVDQPKIPTAKKAGAMDTDLIRFWTDLQQDMGEQITQIMNRQQRFYEDFSGKWTKVSGDISETMSKATMNNDQLNDIQQSWDKHQQRMNQRLETIMKSESETFENLNVKWKALSEDMSKAVMSLGNVNDMRKAQERFLMTWAEMSQEMTRQMARSIEMGSGEFKVLRDTWMEIVEDMDRQARELTEKDPRLAETMKGWNENSRDLNKHLMDHLDASSDDVSKLQTLWTRSLSNITSEFVRSVWDMNMKMFEENAGKLPRGGK
jgi:hypothetical protein